MSWVAVLKALLIVADRVASIIHDKQLLDAGAADEALRSIKGAQDAIGRARAARDAVRDDSDSVRNDPDNIDNDKPAMP